MRKFLAYISVVLVLMNVMGYYGLLVGLQYKNDREWNRRIELGKYNVQDEVRLKIAQNQLNDQLAYSDSFDGVFEKEGAVYKLIRQRIHRDTFHIVAIKDQTGTFIKHAIAEYAETFSDHAPGDQPQSLIILPVFIKEYFLTGCKITSASEGWNSEIQESPTTKSFIPSFISAVIHPPNNA